MATDYGQCWGKFEKGNPISTIIAGGFVAQGKAYLLFAAELITRIQKFDGADSVVGLNIHIYVLAQYDRVDLTCPSSSFRTTPTIKPVKMKVELQ